MGPGVGLGGEGAQHGQERQGRVCAEATAGAGGREHVKGPDPGVFPGLPLWLSW